MVGDVKTGASVDFGGLGWAAQLAAYAHSSLYDPDTGQRLPTPAIDRTTGIIIHLPAGKGECTLYEIDLVAGYRAAELANEIRSVRREAKRWIKPYTSIPDDRRQTLLDRYKSLPADAQARFKALGVDPQDLDAVQSALDAVEQGGSVEALAEPPTIPRGGTYDEGVNVHADEVQALRDRHDQLPADVQLWLGSIAAQANRAAVPFYLQHNPTERRLNIYTALVIAAENGADEQRIRELVAQVTGSDAPMFANVTLGHAVGAMDYGTAGTWFAE